MLNKLAYTFFAISLAACAHTASKTTPSEPVDVVTTKTDTSGYTPISFDLSGPRAEPSAADAQRCIDAGGKVMRDGILGAYRCTQNYPDAGKACSSSSDCIGQCRVNGVVADDGTAEGACQRTDSPFGCFAIVENGRGGPSICVD